ncbi:MAG: tyrosine-type recombinase/integrase [Desulfitobacteriaceae bacterium]|nr:tyrosine-type recombinase/integrase [Desulfitobacteriaceae bacterium]
MLYDTAARAQEIVDLTLRDLHLVNVKSPFVTLTGKGNKSRNVPLMEKTVAHINNYLREFHPHPSTDGKDPLFFSRRDGKPHALSTDTVNLLLGYYANQSRSVCPQIPQHVLKKMSYTDQHCLEDEGAIAGVCDVKDGEGLMVTKQDLFADMVNKEPVDSVMQVEVKKA